MFASTSVRISYIIADILIECKHTQTHTHRVLFAKLRYNAYRNSYSFLAPLCV